MKIVVALIVTLFLITASYAQTTEFTYQGTLKDNAAPANANYDFEFALFDAVSAGNQIGATIPKNTVLVTNGLFAVKLDFGSVFPGANRYLEIRVKLSGQPTLTPLTPRQLVNSAPYSVKSLNADIALSSITAANATQLGGVAANQFVATTDPRMTDSRTPTAGSSNYIQNQNAGAQATSNFNISGNGTAGGSLSGNIVNATTQYNIGGNRLFGISGTGNFFAGVGAGSGNTTGGHNTFFGPSAGLSNTSGSDNAFFGLSSGQTNSTGFGNAFFGSSAGFTNSTGFNNAFFGQSAGFFNSSGSNNAFYGSNAGHANTSGSNNSFFGQDAGTSNSVGFSNTFFGTSAGQANTSGDSNSFFGKEAGKVTTFGVSDAFFGALAGVANTTGTNNAFFGMSAGSSNTTGGSNAFFGKDSGLANTTGGQNAFVGIGAGTSNTTGLRNTTIGAFANVGSGNLAFATAIGSDAVVNTSNTVVLGRNLDTVQIPGAMNVTGTIGASIVNATQQYNIGVNRILSNAGTSNLFAGVGAGSANTSGSRNSFFGENAGSNYINGSDNTIVGASAGINDQSGIANTFVGASAGSSNFGSGNAFFGQNAGSVNTFGNNNTVIGSSADVGSNNLTNATAIGSRAAVSASNSLVLGSINGVNSAAADTNVGIGTTAPGYRLNVVGSTGAGSAQGAAEFANNANDTGVRIKNTATNGRTWTLFSSGGTTGLCQGCFSIYDTTAGQSKLTINTGGNIGIGTTSPQKLLSIAGGVVVDQNNQNTTTNGFGITFGSFSGEGIASNRGAGANPNGLDFYAGAGPGPRMSLTNGGNVGIGTTNPSVKLEVVGGGSTAVLGDGGSLVGVHGISNGAGADGASGVFGQNSNNGPGVYGFGQNGVGVRGSSQGGVGVRAESTSGNIVEGYNNSGRKFHIDNNGTYTGGSDFAEALPASGNRADYEPGDVLVISIKVSGKVEKTSRPYDTRVAGIYSTRPGMLGAEKGGTSRVDADDVPVAIVGIVPTKVSAINGPIRVGDLLTTSGIPGYSMRCSNRVKCVGAVVGKAMEPFSKGKGVIKALVMLR